MSTYYVPAIWHDGNKEITHVVAKLLQNDDTLAVGAKYTIAQIIRMIGNGDQFYTARYMYNKRWQKKAKINIVQRGNNYYLRSNHDNIEEDNLDNMIPMHWLGY